MSHKSLISFIAETNNRYWTILFVNGLVEKETTACAQSQFDAVISFRLFDYFFFHFAVMHGNNWIKLVAISRRQWFECRFVSTRNFWCASTSNGLCEVCARDWIDQNPSDRERILTPIQNLEIDFNLILHSFHFPIMLLWLLLSLSLCNVCLHWTCVFVYTNLMRIVHMNRERKKN